MGADFSQTPEASVGDFFDRVSEDYDQSIRKAIPPYREMLDALLGYCFLGVEKPLRILELGCGTGNLSVLLRALFPNARLTLVDLSPDMLKLAAVKLGAESEQLQLLQGGFMEVSFQPESFDLVISSMALHHLRDAEKPVLYERIFQWLKPGGLFRCADEVLGVPESVHLENMRRWEIWARQNGATEADIQLWSDHAEQYDHYAPLQAHFQWLTTSGFQDVEAYWRNLMWTVFGASRPIEP
ncbi:class I SAM-dependent methyltransferase [Vampirovibrio sp.]|uniref:class I SAM-dependent methyltransferase n=1 Tax=Vampirovibrio sp. TaxID=2717857 RepID=UPI0035944FF7